jgi:ABC-type transport system involved in multi-copper enzyme maturation permease subunit
MDVRKLLMRNSKVTISISFAVLFILFILAGLPVISMALEGSAGKQVFKKEIKEQKNPYANAEIITRIISSANKTFWYDILLNSKVWCINQTYLHCLALTPY